MKALAVVSALAAVAIFVFVMFVWVIPSVTGPAVECVNIDPESCDEVWREEAARQIRWAPLTQVRVVNAYCPQVTLTFAYIFADYREAFC
jgi:hypothetical protein